MTRHDSSGRPATAAAGTFRARCAAPGRRSALAGLAALLLLPLAAPGAARAARPLEVITTTEDLAAIAREVGGDRVRVTALCPGYRDPHFVDAKPSYMVQLRKADLFVEVGRELEVGWAPGLLNGARNARILKGAPGYVDASAAIEVLEVPTTVSRAQGDVHPFGNPHYWLDPSNGALIARAIRDGLSRVSPGDAGRFADNCQDFERRLGERITRWEAEAKALGLPGMQIVTYHRSWSYFARAFGLVVANFVEPRPGIPPSPNHVQALVSQMKTGDVKLMLIEAFFDPRLPEKIARDTGVPMLVLPTSVGAEKDITGYFDLFDHLLARIGVVLKKGSKP